MKYLNALPKFILRNKIFPGMVSINIVRSDTDFFSLQHMPSAFNCLACERDVKIETLLTFSSTTADYQVLASDSQLVEYDYTYWVSRCLGRLFTSYGTNRNTS